MRGRGRLPNRGGMERINPIEQNDSQSDNSHHTDEDKMVFARERK